MGDPRKQVNKFEGPRHPWEADRLAEEKQLTYDYGLKNKKDIWRVTSYVKNIKNQIKKFNTTVGKGVDQERAALLVKLVKYNLLTDSQTLDDALELTARDVFERRLQTILVRQNLAKTVKQARQFIVHGHVKVAGKKITSPSYLVSKEEQFAIEFQANSKLADPEHPERGDSTAKEAPIAVDAASEEVVEEATEAPAEESEEVVEEATKEIAEKLEGNVEVIEAEIKKEDAE